MMERIKKFKGGTYTINRTQKTAETVSYPLVTNAADTYVVVRDIRCEFAFDNLNPASAELKNSGINVGDIAVTEEQSILSGSELVSESTSLTLDVTFDEDNKFIESSILPGFDLTSDLAPFAIEPIPYSATALEVYQNALPTLNKTTNIFTICQPAVAKDSNGNIRTYYISDSNHVQVLAGGADTRAVTSDNLGTAHGRPQALDWDGGDYVYFWSVGSVDDERIYRVNINNSDALDYITVPSLGRLNGSLNSGYHGYGLFIDGNTMWVVDCSYLTNWRIYEINLTTPALTNTTTLANSLSYNWFSAFLDTPSNGKYIIVCGDGKSYVIDLSDMSSLYMTTEFNGLYNTGASATFYATEGVDFLGSGYLMTRLYNDSSFYFIDFNSYDGTSGSLSETSKDKDELFGGNYSASGNRNKIAFYTEPDDEIRTFNADLLVNGVEITEV